MLANRNQYIGPSLPVVTTINATLWNKHHEVATTITREHENVLGGAVPTTDTAKTLYTGYVALSYVNDYQIQGNGPSVFINTSCIKIPRTVMSEYDIVRHIMDSVRIVGITTQEAGFNNGQSTHTTPIAISGVMTVKNNSGETIPRGVRIIARPPRVLVRRLANTMKVSLYGDNIRDNSMEIQRINPYNAMELVPFTPRTSDPVTLTGVYDVVSLLLNMKIRTELAKFLYISERLIVTHDGDNLDADTVVQTVTECVENSRGEGVEYIRDSIQSHSLRLLELAQLLGKLEPSTRAKLSSLIAHTIMPFAQGLVDQLEAITMGVSLTGAKPGDSFELKIDRRGIHKVPAHMY